VAASIRHCTSRSRRARSHPTSQQCSRLSKQLLLLKSSTDVGFNADQGVVDVNQGVVKSAWSIWKEKSLSNVGEPSFQQEALHNWAAFAREAVGGL
jgi:hypothetical protein